MPVKLLIRATTNLPWGKGDPVVVVDDSHVFGDQEGLPDFIVLRISDATKPQVEQYLTSWRTGFQSQILAENGLGYRIKLSVPQRVVDVFGITAGITNNIITELNERYGITIFDKNLEQTYVTFDVPKPVDLQALKGVVSDLFEQELTVKRYFFTSADVDLVIASGGFTDMTTQQVLNRIQDKLA